jgi:hypothetical protein
VVFIVAFLMMLGVQRLLLRFVPPPVPHLPAAETASA